MILRTVSREMLCHRLVHLLFDLSCGGVRRSINLPFGHIEPILEALRNLREPWISPRRDCWALLCFRDQPAFIYSLIWVLNIVYIIFIYPDLIIVSLHPGRGCHIECFQIFKATPYRASLLILLHLLKKLLCCL
jgi:hypothetical protein